MILKLRLESAWDPIVGVDNIWHVKLDYVEFMLLLLHTFYGLVIV